MGLSISKLRKFHALWDELVTLVKTVVRCHAEGEAQSTVRSGKSKPGAGGRATAQRPRKSDMDHILPWLTISYALPPPHSCT